MPNRHIPNPTEMEASSRWAKTWAICYIFIPDVAHCIKSNKGPEKPSSQSKPEESKRHAWTALAFLYIKKTWMHRDSSSRAPCYIAIFQWNDALVPSKVCVDPWVTLVFASCQQSTPRIAKSGFSKSVVPNFWNQQVRRPTCATTTLSHPGVWRSHLHQHLQ